MYVLGGDMSKEVTDYARDEGYINGYQDAVQFLRDEVLSLGVTGQKIAGGLNPAFVRGIEYAIEMLEDGLRDD